MDEFDPRSEPSPTIDRDGGRQVKGDTLSRLINFLRIRREKIDVEKASPDKLAEVKQAQRDFPAAPTTSGPISKN